MSNLNNRCAREGCGKDRNNSDHWNLTWAGHHAFVEPAPQDKPCPDCGDVADPHLCDGRRQVVRRNVEAPQTAPGQRKRDFHELVDAVGPLPMSAMATSGLQPAPGGEYAFCKFIDGEMIECDGYGNEPGWRERNLPAPSSDDCEACEQDSSYRCDVCGVEFCGEHAAKHRHAPSGDEAKGREIALRWFPGLMDAGMSTVLGAVCEAYAAGKAEGAREERKACARLVALMVVDAGAAGKVSQTIALGEARLAIARRGSEGT